MKRHLFYACAFLLAAPLQARAEQHVFLEFDEFLFYPSITTQRFVDGLLDFKGTAFGAQLYETELEALVIQKMREDFADFDIRLETFRPAPPTPFVQWGIDDRAYTFANPCNDADGIDSDGDLELECTTSDNRRLYGIACFEAPGVECAFNAARTFAGSFTLTFGNQPYNGGSGGSVSDPPLFLGSSFVGTDLGRIAQALANSGSHEIAHLFIGNIHTTELNSLMTTENEMGMAIRDKAFVGDVFLQLCEILGPSGPDSACPADTGNATEMDSGSPTVLAQTISPDFDFHEPAPQPIEFDYLFRTTTGVLRVYLQDALLATIHAPTSLATAFTPFEHYVPESAFGGQPRQLRIVLDETDPAQQARIVLRRVKASGFQNGYFQTGDLTGWTVESTGEGGVRVIDEEEIETPPTAIASASATVGEGDHVLLDGASSFDPQGDALSYSWRQIAGLPAVTLQNAGSAVAEFTAPAVPANTTLTFELVVDDGIDVSDPATVDVTVQNVNAPPVADAGDDFSIKVGATAALDGSHSFDPDGTPLAALEFDWSQIAGTPVVLDATDPPAPSFVVPSALGDVLVFKLSVSDGFEASVASAGADSAAADTVAVTIVDNAAPVADAGPDQLRNEGTPVTLSAAGSSDSDGDGLAFFWRQIAGADVAVDGSTALTPAFLAPAVSPGGELLEFEVTVTDDDPFIPKSSSDRVVVHVANINDPPSCDRAFPSRVALWPPDHKLVEVLVNGVVDTDDVYNDITLDIVAVTQDEPVTGIGDGDSAPDAVVRAGDPADSVMLRAERSGTGNGRVYAVEFTASDGFESCTGSTFVQVPHSRKGEAVDDGQTYRSD